MSNPLAPLTPHDRTAIVGIDFVAVPENAHTMVVRVRGEDLFSQKYRFSFDGDSLILTKIAKFHALQSDTSRGLGTQTYPSENMRPSLLTALTNPSLPVKVLHHELGVISDAEKKWLVVSLSERKIEELVLHILPSILQAQGTINLDNSILLQLPPKVVARTLAAQHPDVQRRVLVNCEISAEHQAARLEIIINYPVGTPLTFILEVDEDKMISILSPKLDEISGWPYPCHDFNNYNAFLKRLPKEQLCIIIGCMSPISLSQLLLSFSLDEACILISYLEPRKVADFLVSATYFTKYPKSAAITERANWWSTGEQLIEFEDRSSCYKVNDVKTKANKLESDLFPTQTYSTHQLIIRLKQRDPQQLKEAITVLSKEESKFLINMGVQLDSQPSEQIAYFQMLSTMLLLVKDYPNCHFTRYSFDDNHRHASQIVCHMNNDEIFHLIKLVTLKEALRAIFYLSFLRRANFIYSEHGKEFINTIITQWLQNECRPFHNHKILATAISELGWQETGIASWFLYYLPQAYTARVIRYLKPVLVKQAVYFLYHNMRGDSDSSELDIPLCRVALENIDKRLLLQGSPISSDGLPIDSEKTLQTPSELPTTVESSCLQPSFPEASAVTVAESSIAHPSKNVEASINTQSKAEAVPRGEVKTADTALKSTRYVVQARVTDKNRSAEDFYDSQSIEESTVLVSEKSLVRNTQKQKINNKFKQMKTLKDYQRQKKSDEDYFVELANKLPPEALKYLVQIKPSSLSLFHPSLITRLPPLAVECIFDHTENAPALWCTLLVGNFSQELFDQFQQLHFKKRLKVNRLLTESQWLSVAKKLSESQLPFWVDFRSELQTLFFNGQFANSTTKLTRYLRVCDPQQFSAILESIAAEQISASLAALPPARAADLLIEASTHRKTSIILFFLYRSSKENLSLIIQSTPDKYVIERIKIKRNSEGQKSPIKYEIKFHGIRQKLTKNFEMIQHLDKLRTSWIMPGDDSKGTASTSPKSFVRLAFLFGQEKRHNRVTKIIRRNFFALRTRLLDIQLAAPRRRVNVLQSTENYGQSTQNHVQYYDDRLKLYPILRSPKLDSQLDVSEIPPGRFKTPYSMDENFISFTMTHAESQGYEFIMSKEYSELMMQMLDELKRMMPEKTFRGRTIQPGLQGLVPVAGCLIAARGGPSLTRYLAGKTGVPHELNILILKKLCEDLSFCHQGDFYFRDIKPDNILIAEFADHATTSQQRHELPQLYSVDLSDMCLLNPDPEGEHFSIVDMDANTGTEAFMTSEILELKKGTTEYAELALALRAADNYAMFLTIFYTISAKARKVIIRPCDYPQDSPFYIADDNGVSMRKFGILHPNSTPADDIDVLLDLIEDYVAEEFKGDVRLFLTNPTLYDFDHTIDEVMIWNRDLDKHYQANIQQTEEIISDITDIPSTTCDASLKANSNEALPNEDSKAFSTTKSLSI
ncbi:hypothetical protein D5018_15905 [Parashewanella curva]|uniref:Protein kinase domain-containing protein n=1 Tax=Parashewanella curva TaxID=2338552 RepID=A0A3L8PTH7_9GAMM|nr:serine/threonine-protein kinase [Parashewanella curva]RLV58701.1 hypothetical protein D5018_15905 [Parashewanella curva]